jgi:dTMP kinase
MSKTNKKGVLISFEGSEGCGKTTQIRRLANRCQDSGNDIVVTREPGGTEIGEEIRHLLKHTIKGERMTPEAELLLFAASRAQLVRELIIPSVNEGKMVLCDRYLDSTTVYQGVARQIAEDPVNNINSFAVGNIIPDLTIVLDVPAELGMKRIKNRFSDLPDRMEQETIEFYAKVREGYLVLANSIPDRFIVVDGTLNQDEIEEKIWEEVSLRYF